MNTHANEHGLGPGQLPGAKVAYQVVGVGLIRPPPSLSVSVRLQTVKINQHNEGKLALAPNFGRLLLVDQAYGFSCR